MRIKETNTQFFFVNSYSKWKIKDTRHLANIAVGIKFIQKQFNNALISVFIHNERFDDFKKLLDLFEINIKSVQIFTIEKFYDKYLSIYSENIFIFFSAHGIENIGIDSNLINLSPSELYMNLSKSKKLKNIFIFFGQCYAGLYKSFTKTNTKLNFYIYGCSDEYVGWSSESILEKSEDNFIKDINVKLKKLLEEYPELNKLSLLLLEIFINIKMLLNKNICEITLQDFYKKLRLQYVDDHLENNLGDDNKYINLRKEVSKLKNEIDNFYFKPNPDNEKYLELEELYNKKKSDLKLYDDFLEEQKSINYYKKFKEDIKKNGKMRITQLYNGPKALVNADDFFTSMFRSVVMGWCSQNFIWFAQY